MAIRFFFEYSNLIVQLPVNPEALIINSDSNNQGIEIVKLGDASILRDIKLKTCEVKSFFPVNSEPPYVLTKGLFQGPQFYIDFFDRVRKDKKPMRFTVSDMPVNMLVSIESFDYGKQAGDEDMQYKLKLKEYKPIGAKLVTIVPPKTTTPLTSAQPTIITTSPVIERPKTGFAIGDSVIVNGNYWSSSYGDPPYGVFNDFVGKIGHIVADTTRKYRYSIYTLEGGARGWVGADQLKIR